jgi:hypothetical protein
MSFWFSFSLWSRVLSISLCSYWSFVLLLLRTVCSVHLPIYLLGCWFFAGSIFWAPCMFWLLTPCQMYGWQRFLSHSVDCLFNLTNISFAVQKAFSFMQSHLPILSFNSWAIWVLLIITYACYVPVDSLFFLRIILQF